MPSWRRLSWCHEWDRGRERPESRHVHARHHPHSHQLRVSSSAFSPSATHVHVTHCTARHAHVRYMVAPLPAHHAPSLARLYPHQRIWGVRITRLRSPALVDETLFAATPTPLRCPQTPSSLRLNSARSSLSHLQTYKMDSIYALHALTGNNTVTFYVFFGQLLVGRAKT